jgi:tetratricopeptide (TPR) repeat protein
VRGELWETALHYLRQAGTKAFARSANRDAVSYFEQALAALTHLPQTREMLEQAIDLRFDLRPSLFALNRLEGLVEHLREAEGLAKRLGDQRRLGWISTHKSHYLWSTGHAAEARALAESAQAIAEELGDVPLQVGANHYLASVCLTSGDYRQADTVLRKVLQLVGGDRSRERHGLTAYPAVMARGYLAWSLAERGAFDEAMVYGQDAVRLAESLDHPFSWINASWSAAHLYRLKGDLAIAIRLLERALALCRDWHIIRLSRTTAGFLGFVYVLSGRAAEGLPLLDEAQESDEQWQTLIVAHMGEACRLADRVAEALAYAGRALTFARQRGQRGYEAWALRLLGEIAAHRDLPDVATADGHYRQAIALAEELGMRPLIAHCHLGLGKLYQRTGKLDQAEEHLTTATTMYREMGMTYWLEQAEAELRQLA